MKYLIISDLHLTKKFNIKKFNAIYDLFKSVDRIIINGDFFESYACTFSEFINSNWSELFELMLEKKTIYISGNHDEIEELDDRMNLFCITHAKRTELEFKEKKFIIEHGHLITNDLPESRKFIRKLKYLNSLLELPVTYFSRGILQMVYSYSDIKKLKKYSSANMKENEYLVTGHTHIQEMDNKNRYINTGFCRFNYLQYAVIEDSVIELFSKKV